MFLVLSGGDRKYEYLQENNMSSSLAAEVYDKYGDEGLAAMKKAWEETRDMPGSSDQKAVHAIMMAQAAVRYVKQFLFVKYSSIFVYFFYRRVKVTK